MVASITTAGSAVALSTAPAKSLVRLNREADPDYAPYCLRCSTMARMREIEPFFWECRAGCGARHDERAPRSAGLHAVFESDLGYAGEEMDALFHVAPQPPDVEALQTLAERTERALDLRSRGFWDVMVTTVRRLGIDVLADFLAACSPRRIIGLIGDLRRAEAFRDLWENESRRFAGDCMRLAQAASRDQKDYVNLLHWKVAVEAERDALAQQLERRVSEDAALLALDGDLIEAAYQAWRGRLSLSFREALVQARSAALASGTLGKSESSSTCPTPGA